MSLEIGSERVNYFSKRSNKSSGDKARPRTQVSWFPHFLQTHTWAVPPSPNLCKDLSSLRARFLSLLFSEHSRCSIKTWYSE